MVLTLQKMSTQEALLRPYRQGRIDREEIAGGFVYFAGDSGIRRNQKIRCLERPAAWELGESLVGDDLPPELK